MSRPFKPLNLPVHVHIQKILVKVLLVKMTLVDQPNMEQATHTFIYMLLSISGMQYSALVDTWSSINSL